MGYGVHPVSAREWARTLRRFWEDQTGCALDVSTSVIAAERLATEQRRGLAVLICSVQRQEHKATSRCATFFFCKGAPQSLLILLLCDTALNGMPQCSHFYSPCLRRTKLIRLHSTRRVGTGLSTDHVSPEWQVIEHLDCIVMALTSALSSNAQWDLWMLLGILPHVQCQITVDCQQAGWSRIQRIRGADSCLSKSILQREPTLLKSTLSRSRKSPA